MKFLKSFSFKFFIVVILSFILISCVEDINMNDKVVMRNHEGYIQWQLEGEETWNNLIALEDLTGENGVGIDTIYINENNVLIIKYTDGTQKGLGNINGQNGVGISSMIINENGELVIRFSNDQVINVGNVVGQNGEDGREIELRTQDGYIQWRYENEEGWRNLIPLNDITGPTGPTGVVGVGIETLSINDANELVVVYSNGTEMNLGVIVGQDGVDGISIVNVMVNEEGHLIITLSNDQTIDAGLVVGQNGEDGREIELRTEDGYIQWRYENEEGWRNLIPLMDITGPTGVAGVGIETLSINDANELVIVYSNGTEMNLGVIVGQNGVDGISIVNVMVNEDGHLIITLSNDQTIDAGLVVGQNGTDGLSAYEIYKKYYPNYQGSEEQWLDDLINGRLGIMESYDVTLELNGGSLPDELSSVISAPRFTTVDLPIPTRMGYEFLGWFTGYSVLDDKFTSAIPVVRDITLFAKWVEIHVESFNLTNDELTIGKGESLTLDYVILPSNALNHQLIPIYNNEFVSIDEFGVVTGLSLGTTTITLVTQDGAFSDTITITVVDKTIPEMIGVNPMPGTVIISDPFIWTIQANDDYLYKLEIDHSLEDILPEFTVYASEENPYGSLEAKAEFEANGVFVTYNALTQTWTINFGEIVTDVFVNYTNVSFYLVIEDDSGNQWGSMYEVSVENTFNYRFISYEEFVYNEIIFSDTYETMKANILKYQTVLGISADTMGLFNSLPADQGRQQAIIGAMLATKDYYFGLEGIRDLFEFFVYKEYTKHEFIQAVDHAETQDDMVCALLTYVPELNLLRQIIISQGAYELIGSNYTTALFDLNAFIDSGNTYVVEYVARRLLEERSNTESNKFFGVVPITDVIRLALDSDYTQPELVSITPSTGNIIIKDPFIWTIQANDAHLYELEIDHSLEGILPQFSVYASTENPYGTLEDKALFEEAGVIVTYDSVTQTWTINFGTAISQVFVEQRNVTFYLVIEDESGNQWGSMYEVSAENTFTYTFISHEEFVYNEIIHSDSYDTMKSNILSYSDVLGISLDTMTLFNSLPADQGRQQAIIGGMIMARPEMLSLENIKEIFEFIVYKEYKKFEFINAVDNAQNVNEMKAAFLTYVPELNNLRQLLISEGYTDLIGTNYTTALFDLNAFIEADNNYVLDYVATTLLEVRSMTVDNRFYGVVAITDAIRLALDSDYTLPEFVGVTPTPGTIIVKEPFIWTIQANDEYLYKLEIDHSLDGILPEFSVYASVENPYGSLDAKAEFEANGVFVTYDDLTQTWTINFGKAVTDLFIAQQNVSFYIVIEDESGNQWGSMYNVTADNTFTYTFIAYTVHAYDEIMSSATNEEMEANIILYQDALGIDEITMTNYYNLTESKQQTILNGMMVSKELFTSLEKISDFFVFYVENAM